MLSVACRTDIVGGRHRCDVLDLVQLTDSWRDVFPQSVQDRYDIVETRNAAAVMRVTTPEAFEDMVQVLDGFVMTLDKLTTPGGNKSVIAKELDTTFRVRGWREAKFEQDLTTRLTIYRWTESAEPEETREVSSTNSYGGHKVDNVLGRAALDVEWNPKDGNLDRDLANYVSLHEGGVIDAGVIVTRSGDGLRGMVRDLIAKVKDVPYSAEDVVWAERMRKLPDDPLGTTTTANFEKLLPRLERGDGRGCPVLAIAITERTYAPPDTAIADEVQRLIALAAAAQPPPDQPVDSV